MKSFLKIVISAVALGVMASIPVLRAQDQTPPAEGAKKGKGGRGMMSVEDQVAAIDKAVGGLTADESAKIKDIISKTRDDMQALAPEDRRTKGREMMQAQHDQIRAVLTADQQTKFDAMPPPGRGGKKKKDN